MVVRHTSGIHQYYHRKRKGKICLLRVRCVLKCDAIWNVSRHLFWSEKVMIILWETIAYFFFRLNNWSWFEFGHRLWTFINCTILIVFFSRSLSLFLLLYCRVFFFLYFQSNRNMRWSLNIYLNSFQYKRLSIDRKQKRLIQN